MSALDIFMQVIGYMGAIGIAIFSMPQLISIIKTKNTSNVNAWLFGLLAISSLCFMISGFYSFYITLSESGINSAAFQLAVSIANFFSFAIATIVLIFKLVNKIRAKKVNMTEAEFCNQRSKR